MAGHLAPCFPALLAGWLLAGAAWADVDAVLSASGRSDADRQRDATDHPAQLIDFAGVEPGMTVLDLFAGSGYYSELLSAAVGPDGRVLLHNNAAYLGFAGTALDARLAAGAPANVTRMDAEAADLGLDQSSLDGVFMILVFHDFWYRGDDWQVTAEQVLPQLYQALRQGGFVLIVDHVAGAGSGTSAAQELHRIEPSAVAPVMQAQGFRLADESDLLANAADDHRIEVFDAAVRGHTDRLVQRYIKP